MLAGLLALTVAWGAVGAWSAATHASAASSVVATDEPLSLDAQRIYRSLSDADATQAAAFLYGGLEPFSVRDRYLADISQAARNLEAATAAAGTRAASSRLTILAAELPVYSGLIETARADNRIGYPLGAAYLREASGLMRAKLLPAARDLYAQENAQLASAHRQATAVPYPALVVVLLAVLGLVFSQVWLARRSRRLINPGLLLGSAAGLTALVWLASAQIVAASHLISAKDLGSEPVQALATAEIAALQAHADESLTLIDRSGDDSFQQDFLALQASLGPGRGTLLTAAATAASGSPGAQPAVAAARGAHAWYASHREVRRLDDGGSYAAAVRRAIGPGASDSGELFGGLDGHLTAAISADQAFFRSAATAGRSDLAGLEVGMIALALVMAAGCSWGISRRLVEYR